MPTPTILRTGWQRLNTVCQGGIRRGELVQVNGFAHQYKTRFALSLFKQIALYNTPQLTDPKKKPLLIHISFEDRCVANLKCLHQLLNAGRTGLDDFEKKDRLNKWGSIKDQLTVNGYHVKMGYCCPEAYSYQDVFDSVIQRYEENGYEIHLIVLDALGELAKTVTPDEPRQLTSIQEVFRQTQMFCKERNIAVITPQQLGCQAKHLLRTDASLPENQFVKVLTDKRRYTDPESLNSYVDLDLFIHVCRRKDRRYLTVQRGDRCLATGSEQHGSYFVLPFQDAVLLDDLKSVDTALDCLPL